MMAAATTTDDDRVATLRRRTVGEFLDVHRLRLVVPVPRQPRNVLRLLAVWPSLVPYAIRTLAIVVQPPYEPWSPDRKLAERRSGPSPASRISSETSTLYSAPSRSRTT